MMGYYPE